MVFTKEEVRDHFPLDERLKLEKAKSQNSTIYWINELISSSTHNGASDVPSLLQMTKGVTEQLESMYKDKEASEDTEAVQSLTDQVEALYREKEEVLSQFPGTKSLSELVDTIKGMEEQLVQFYKEKENTP